MISLCTERRGIQQNARNIDNERIMLTYELPLSEIVVDFHDTLKTISSGYASFDYEDAGYKSSPVVKVRWRESPFCNGSFELFWLCYRWQYCSMASQLMN